MLSGIFMLCIYTYQFVCCRNFSLLFHETSNLIVKLSMDHYISHSHNNYFQPIIYIELGSQNFVLSLNSSNSEAMGLVSPARIFDKSMLVSKNFVNL